MPESDSLAESRGTTVNPRESVEALSREELKGRVVEKICGISGLWMGIPADEVVVGRHLPTITMRLTDSGEVSGVIVSQFLSGKEVIVSAYGWGGEETTDPNVLGSNDVLRVANWAKKGESELRAMLETVAINGSDGKGRFFARLGASKDGGATIRLEDGTPTLSLEGMTDEQLKETLRKIDGLRNELESKLRPTAEERRV